MVNKEVLNELAKMVAGGTLARNAFEQAVKSEVPPVKKPGLRVFLERLESINAHLNELNKALELRTLSTPKKEIPVKPVVH